MAVQSVKANINGQNYNLTYNSTSGKWEATITAPSVTSWHEPNNKYGITVTATDDAGNSTVKDRTDSTLSSALQLRVLEKVKPTVSLTSPSSGARVITATPQIKFSLRDSDSGIKISSLQLKIDGGSAIGHDASGMICTSVSGGYDCVYVPPTALSEGAHTITIQVSDNDGNTSDLLSSGFTVDTFLYIDFKNMKFELIDRKYKEQLLESDKNIIEITTEYTTKELINYSYKPLENQYIYRKLVV